MDNSDLRAVRLTGRAARFVALLRDFGHLDESGVDRLLLSLADVEGDARGALVDIGAVRRHAAAMLFPEVATGDGTVLEEDWSLLFS